VSHRFDVWAPSAGAVAVVLGDGSRLEMAPHPERSGWWTAAVARGGPGTRYGFSVDGGAVRPDPRSAFQPDGPDGMSEVAEPGGSAWSDGGWRGFHLPSAVLYELHVGTFTPEGTFDAVIGRLDHLLDLGVTAIELMPVAEFPGERGWGYDGVDLYAPHHSYGGPEGLARLVDACHRRGMAVVLDVVYNHLGPAGNYLQEFGPYFTDRYATPWGRAVNLDGPESDEVRRFFIENALMWLRDYHFDGLRLDAVHAIVDTSAVHLLEELSGEVEQLSAATGIRRWLIAESDLNDPRIVHRPEVGGYGIDAQWSDDFHHSLHAAFTGETEGYYSDFGSLADVAYSVGHAYVYDGRYSPHRRRRHGRPVTGLPGWAFLGYSQNHDQVGNRAAGDRSSALMSRGRLKAAAALVLTAPFVPMLFQGEEWGASGPFQYFTDHPDLELGRAVSEGRTHEFVAFGWDPADVPDPQDPETFARSRLDWSERDEPAHAGMLDWYRRLIRLRRSEPDLTDGALGRVHVDLPGPDVLVMTRGRITVALNIGAGATLVPTAPGRELVLASGADTQVEDGGLILPPDSVAVLRSPLG